MDKNLIFLFLFFSVLNIILFLIILRKHNSFFKRFQFLLKIEAGENIEQILKENLEKMEEMEKRIEEIKLLENKLLEILPTCLQKIGVIRFKAFEDIGGDQSFSLAILDGNNNGVVITSIYARDTNRIYAKPIEDGKSNYTLSEEEQQALKKATG